ncbi:hypothetical protein Zmor_006208 [Zophobas morio]|uniref:Uncharacterized protein n=1 Tax=Zophobas morio TaxID=2755281 RepID=A0AA38IX02_9CUCU|nr:hypothetical protein Zmor_006208 [Zophobas morio]
MNCLLSGNTSPIRSFFTRTVSLASKRSLACPLERISFAARSADQCFVFTRLDSELSRADFEAISRKWTLTLRLRDRKLSMRRSGSTDRHA